MNRNKMRDIAYKRGNILTVRNPAYLEVVRKFTVDAVLEDVTPKGDITTEAVLRKDVPRTAHIIAKEDGIISGLEEFEWFLSRYGIHVHPFKRDGSRIRTGDVICELHGNESALMKTERTGLNLLQRMSGISTQTHEVALKARPLLIAATRKTPWGMLDSKAVLLGGGATHRLGLWDSILIKENHLQALLEEGISNPIEIAIRRAWEMRKKSIFIEIETQTPDEALESAEIFDMLISDTKETVPCIIMLDNFKPSDIRTIVRTLKNEGVYDNVLIEVSGNITPENVAEYKDSGADVASMGCLTHSAKALDMTQLIIRK
ncbi:MAG: carboxylating nicotinate-nucleotide diphosphorylase [Candidatus Micrarchaeota archaeon]|nr:carboxylating nicotinate-nucleotide diphosphorylase [Candidatus Micrarchaeota archaeon]